MLKVDGELEQITVAKTYEAEQQHVFAFWDDLDDSQRQALLDQLGQVDFQLLAKLANLIEEEPGGMTAEIAPMEIQQADAAERVRLAAIGNQALAEGKVAALVVAGGQGTRLGWDGPKGTHPVGSVSGKSLFQLFAEQVQAIGAAAGKPLPWWVMTSQENRAQTEAYFEEHGAFGLDPAQLTFLTQRSLPATTPEGKLLLAEKHRLATSPNGHGGVFELLTEGGALERLEEAGIEHVFYFQVDNPLCRVADPVFLGAHIEGQAEISTKVVEKVDPQEKIGLVVSREGRPAVVEYSEIGPAQQEARDEDGRLLFRGGNTAIHALSVAFLRRLVDDGFRLEYHLARKKVPFVDPDGNAVAPEEPNGVKFELFVFDLMREAAKHVAFQVPRDEEFEPLKNKDGPYSPETVRQALSDRAKRWLSQAAAAAPEAETVEISPLTALDPEGVKAKLGELNLEPQDGVLSL